MAVSSTKIYFVVHRKCALLLVTWLVIGSVLIWHMYRPESFLWTSLTIRVQLLWPLCSTFILGLLVTMWVWMANMAFESDLNQATCGEEEEEIKSQLLPSSGVQFRRTLCPPKCLTTQVNWALRPAATVIFSNGEMKPGSNPVTANLTFLTCVSLRVIIILT